MAVTRITSTRNGTGAINYVLRPKAKERERVRAISGNAVLLDFAPGYAQTTHEQMRHVREVNNKQGLNPKTNERYVQAYRVIQSFSDEELNPDDENDVEKCNEIGLALAKELYPDNQVLVVTHTDGIGGKLHNHLVVNAVKFTNGKSLRGKETNWDYIAKVNDEVVQRYGIKPIEKGKAKDLRTQAEIELSERGEYVWKDDLKERINQSIESDEVSDRDTFKSYMSKEFDVDVRFRGKGMSFAFTDENEKQRRIRAGRLGSDYQRENVEQMIQSKEKEPEPEVKIVSTPRNSARSSLSVSSIMKELKQSMNEKVVDTPKAPQKAEIDAQKAEREKREREAKELQERRKRQELAEKRKKQLERQRQQERQEQLEREQAERERVREELRQKQELERQRRKSEFMKNVKYVQSDFEMSSSGSPEFIGYKDLRTNRFLNDEETQWYKDYKEEQERMKNKEVETQRNNRNDIGLDF